MKDKLVPMPMTKVVDMFNSPLKGELLINYSTGYDRCLKIQKQIGHHIADQFIKDDFTYSLGVNPTMHVDESALIAYDRDITYSIRSDNPDKMYGIDISIAGRKLFNIGKDFPITVVVWRSASDRVYCEFTYREQYLTDILNLYQTEDRNAIHYYLFNNIKMGDLKSLTRSGNMVEPEEEEINYDGAEDQNSRGTDEGTRREG